MTTTLPPLPTPDTTAPAAAPALSLIYADDAMDWLDASEMEIRIEYGYLTEWLKREDSAAAREEKKRVLAAAKQKGIAL